MYFLYFALIFSFFLVILSQAFTLCNLSYAKKPIRFFFISSSYLLQTKISSKIQSNNSLAYPFLFFNMVVSYIVIFYG